MGMTAMPEFPKAHENWAYLLDRFDFQHLWKADLRTTPLVVYTEDWHEVFCEADDDDHDHDNDDEEEMITVA